MQGAPASGLNLESPSLRDEVVSLAARVHALDIRVLERVEDGASRDAFTARVIEVLRETEVLCQRLVEGHGALASQPPDADPETLEFMQALDAMLAEAAGVSKVADVAFMAALELGQRRRRLEQEPPPDPWDRVSECGGGLRRVTKSLAAIDRSLAELSGTPGRLGYDSEVAIALKTRRLYRKLWTFAEQRPEPAGADEVRGCLRGAGTLLAMMVGRDEYCRLRAHDRRHMRELQARILGWLVQEDPDVRAGARTWADFAGFASVLRAISHRQELVEHDRQVLVTAWSLLEAQAPGDEILAELRRVEGLDPGLDAVVALGSPAASDLREVVDALRSRLGLSAPEARAGTAADFL